MSDAIMPTPKRQRPSGSETRHRAGLIGFRANAAERAELDALADRLGLSLSSYVRSRALLAPTTRAMRRPTVERAALSQALAQLGKCGSNLNQIARVLNSGGEDVGDIPAAVEEFRATCRAILQAIGKRSTDNPAL